MTVEEAITLLQREDSKAELHVCHFRKFGGRAIPKIFPLAEIRRLEGGRLCLVEEDDRKLYLADR